MSSGIKIKIVCVCRDAFETQEQFLEHIKYCQVFKNYHKYDKRKGGEQ